MSTAHAPRLTLDDADIARREAVERYFATHDEMLAVLDADGRFVAVNPTFERLVGREESVVLGRGFLNVVPRDDHAHVRTAFVQSRKQRSTRRAEARFLGADGRSRWISWTFSPSDDGTRVCVAGHDVTERLELGRLKDEFVSVVSHELRTPLTSINGSLSLVLGGVAGPLPARATELVGIAHSNCDRLIRLITDILDIEKIESGHVEFRVEHVDCAELLQRAVRQNEAYASEHGVALGLTVEPSVASVYGDPDRLMQVLTNLLSNAVKFSPEGGAVDVAARREPGHVIWEIHDRGPGIPETYREKIFDRFVQVDGSDTRARGGTGLGLSIVRSIVEHHRGEVTFSAREGGGTTFSVRLPAPDPGMSLLIPVQSSYGTSRVGPERGKV